MAGRSTAEETTDFPLATSKTMEGVTWRCFEKDGEGWAAVGHYGVRCRAQAATLVLAQDRVKILEGDIKVLEASQAGWRKAAESEQERGKGLEVALQMQQKDAEKRERWQRIRDVSVVAAVALNVVATIVLGVVK